MIQELWRRLEAWGSINAPAMLEDLNPGAGENELLSLQEGLGIDLPRDFIDSLKVHNGENDGWPCKVFADRGAYLSTEGILEIWTLLQKIASEMTAYTDQMDVEEQIREGIVRVEGPVKPVDFSPKWVPILDCNGDVFWAIDFDPSDGGVVGQIVEVYWEGNSWKVIADSFKDLLSTYVLSLEANEYRIINGQPTQESV